MDCYIKKLAGNIAYDNCTPTRAKAGLETRAVIISKSDLDLTAVTSSGSVVTNITLASGATGYYCDWIKQQGNATAAFSSAENSADVFNQSFVARIHGQGSQDAERARELASGEYIVITQTKWKGTDNVEAYKVYGFDSGLKMSELTHSVNENDGSMLYTLSSVENGGGEMYPFMVYNEGSYAANKARFDALFA
jgi:hypothetical protein